MNLNRFIDFGTLFVEFSVTKHSLNKLILFELKFHRLDAIHPLLFRASSHGIMMRITRLISYAFGDERDSTTFVSLFSSAFTVRPYQVRYFLRLDDVCINKSKNRLVGNGQTNVSIANCRIYDIVILNVCSFQTHLFLFVCLRTGAGRYVCD